MRKLAVLLGVLAMATAVQAAVVNYQMKVNNQLVTNLVGGVPTIDATNMEALGIEPGVPFELNVQVYTNSMNGTTKLGVVQFGFNLTSSAGGLNPGRSYLNDPDYLTTPDLDATLNTYELWGGPGEADGTGVPPMIPVKFVNAFQGQIDRNGYLVLAQTGAMSATKFNSTGYKDAYGAGVYSTITTGMMTWDGATTTSLILSAVPSAQLVATGVVGATSANPTSVGGYTLNFVGVPEPVTMSLLVIGGLGLLARRNRRA